VEMTLRNPECPEVGLLLLLLKDLWTGDLPLGGETGIGRGRMKGREATLTLQENGKSEQWKISPAPTQQDPDALQVEGDKAALEGFVSEALTAYFTAGGVTT
jgi:hypothetical protein